mmetsp:Transcript_38141/g.107794  ORF Transcript_38141/g.107794 Transcript_38141/m.107794 type:complete len:203 (-) Transcript_38141:736-1344(-)
MLPCVARQGAGSASPAAELTIPSLFTTATEELYPIITSGGRVPCLPTEEQIVRSSFRSARVGGGGCLLHLLPLCIYDTARGAAWASWPIAGVPDIDDGTAWHPDLDVHVGDRVSRLSGFDDGLCRASGANHWHDQADRLGDPAVNGGGHGGLAHGRPNLNPAAEMLSDGGARFDRRGCSLPDAFRLAPGLRHLIPNCLDGAP